MKLLFCLIVCILNNACTIDLPSYIPKCYFWDPQLSECMTEKANIAVKRLLLGDPQIGLPSMSPLYLSKVDFEGKHLMISATYTYFHGLRNINIRKIVFDIRGHAECYSTLDVLRVTGFYSINRGTILSRSVFGSGKFSMTLVGNSMEHNAEFIIYEKEKEHYMKFTNVTVANFRTNYIHYYFQNIRSPRHGDMNAFINSNWRIVTDEIKPSLEKYMNLFYRMPIEAVSDHVPLERKYYF